MCIGLGSTQTLLFSCECDLLDIVPEGDPSLLGAPCDVENRLYCQIHRRFRLVPVRTRRVSESSLHECGIGQTGSKPNEPHKS